MEGPRSQEAGEAFRKAAESLPDRQPVEPLKDDAGKKAFSEASRILKEAAAGADQDLASKISEAVRNGDMKEAADLIAQKAEQEAKKE